MKRTRLTALIAAILLPVTGLRAADVDFEKQIWPILEKTCLECHGPKKQKGKFRLDSPQALLEAAGKPGDKEPVLVAGKPAESTLYELVTLPADDDDIMPPADSNKPLTKEQTDLIKQWIEQKMPFGHWKGLTSHETDREPDLITTLEAPKADEGALKKLQDLGALAMPIAQNTNLITVDFRGVADQIGDSHLAMLAPLSEQVAWINLANTKISDDGLKHLAGLKHLNRLHLEKTAIGDNALAHLKNAKNLEYINLYGTKVTDAGLKNLAALPQLKKVFVWQTGVTKEGAESLKKDHPKLDVNRGWEGPIVDPKAADAKSGELSIKDIMQKAHKSKLHEKVIGGAKGDELKELLGYYEVLAKAKCPKGDGKSWTEKTSALLAAAKKIEAGDAAGIEALKAATNCKACHSIHK